jgi:adenosyl cobinamide kinase/adenosyl cobinamide phosphate guanylyltransferase
LALTLILGGVASGKSAYAESLVAGEVLYVATAIGRVDEGLQERIAAHQSRRPADWPVLVTVENIAMKAAEQYPEYRTVLLDGFGLVVAAALENDDPASKVHAEIDGIIRDTSRRDWIVVSEEAGLAPVALTTLGRSFQDILGRSNQLLSAAASRAVLVVAGRPLDLPTG